MAEAQVVVRVEHRELGDAVREGERFLEIKKQLNNTKITLQADVRQASDALSTVGKSIKAIKEEIAGIEKFNKANPASQIDLSTYKRDLQELIALQKEWTNQRDTAKSNLNTIKNALSENARDIANNKELQKTINDRIKAADDLAKAESKAAQVQAKADEDAARALNARQKAAQAAEQEFKKLRDAEAELARQTAWQKGVDAGRIVSGNGGANEEAIKKQAEAMDELRKAEAEEQAQLAQSKRDAETERLNRQAEAAERVRSVLQGISSVMSAGATVSNALGNFASGIGNSFSGMAQLFGNNNVSTALTRFLTYNALRGITGNMSNIVSRYDIMSTFLPYMSVAGVGQDQAQTALDRVNEAILGLPIGLDESAQRLRRYQMFLGNINDATNLTIGAQNAILAGGASSSMQNMAYLQIDRLLAAGKLNTSRQWLSLIQGLGVSMRFVSQQMGTVGMTANELAAGLTSGAISTESFLEALMELGKGESDAAQGLEATLEIYKGTIQAWINNIQFAATRGGENVMKALNQTLVDSTGQGITGYMKIYRDTLNSVFGKPGEGGIAGWITSNPDALVSVMGKGYDLIQAVSRFSASDTGTMVLENTGRLFDGVAVALNAIPDGKLEEFVAFASTLAGPLGAGFSASSGLGQMLGIFERFKEFDFNMLVSDISDAVGAMANLTNSLLNLVDDETMSKLLAYGLVFGKPVGSILSTGAGAVSSIASWSLLRRIANGGAAAATGAAGAAGAAAGAVGATGATSFGWGLTNTPLSWAVASALPELLVAGGGVGLLALLSSASNRSYAQVRGELGYEQYGVGLQDVAAVLSGVRANSPVLPAFNRQTADEYKVARQQNLEALQAAYKEQYDLIMGYEEDRAYVRETIKSIEDRMNRGDASLTSGEINSLPGLRQTSRDLDEKISATGKRMNELNGEIAKQGSELGKLTIKYGDYEIVLEDTDTAMQQSAEHMSAFAQYFDQLSSNLTEIRNSAAESFAGQLTGFGALEAAETPKVGSFLAEDTANIESQTKMAQAAIDNLDDIKEYIDSLEPGSEEGVRLSEYVHEILGLEDLEEVVPRLSEVANQLEGGEIGERLMTALNEFTLNNETAANLKTSMEGFGTTVTTFLDQTSQAIDKAFSFETAISKLVDGLPDQIGNINTALVDPLGQITQTTKQWHDDAIAPFEKFPKSIEDEQGPTKTATEGLGTAVQDGANSAKQKATTALEGLRDVVVQKIQELQSELGNQTIDINVTANMNVTTTGTGAVSLNGAPSVAVSEAIESGGRATGGPIWKPFGSDTVPMMLTPGEYVIRKGAADFFGRGLLERINALDIGGAFDRLILNSPVTAGRYGGNVYNKDSHASVNQTFINSSPDYGRRRAMRFAHAL